MSFTYAQRKRLQGPQNTEPERTTAPGPSMDALMTGAARPTAAQKGRSIDLDSAMKAKMENAFGDLSAVKLYESTAVGEAGAEAIAQGNEIAFAPGMANFSTKAGQERLGHELSHVMSQRSGQVRGSGFLANASLEARADREGAMAAAGQQVYAGPVSHALSGASPSPAAAGIMQARRDVDRAERIGSAMLFDKDRQDFYKNSAKPPKTLVSDQEKAWFDNKMKSGDRGFIKEIRKRQKAARARLLKHREAMQGPNAQMLDYETSFSAPAQEMRLYNLMMGQASKDTAPVQPGRENLILDEDVRKNERVKQIIASPLEDNKEGAPIRNELLNPKLRYLLLRSAGWNKEANKLLSDAGNKYRLKQGGMPSKKRPRLIEEPNIMNEEPRSKYADDFDLLNSQQGTDEERKKAYNSIAVPTARNMTNNQRHAVSEYITGSSGFNAYLREQKDNIYYPKTKKEIQSTQKEVNEISRAIQNNPLPEKLTTYRGTTDKFFAVLLKQNGLEEAVNEDGYVNHKWLNQNQDLLQKNLVGKTFHEKAFTSTSTEKRFAKKWSQESSKNELMMDYYLKGNRKKAKKIEKLADENPELLPGAHLMTMNLPKGSKGAFVDRTTDGTSKDGITQREVPLDKGSMFKISDIRKMENADSYELVMDLLAEEEGVKKGKKKKKN